MRTPDRTTRLVSLAIAAFAAVAISSAPAAAQAQVQTVNTYGMAGCGLGSMLFGDQPGIVQILAATTNGIFANQTFGITTGTSNCVDASVPVVQVASFVETNRSALVKDMARGSGETVRTLSTLAGCPDVAAVGRHLQRNFDRVFPSVAATDREVSAAVVAQLRDTPELGCAKLRPTEKTAGRAGNSPTLAARRR